MYLGELHSSTAVAVKVLKASDPRSREAFLTEMAILKSLHHSNIVQFLGACVLQNTVALVTEYLPEGDLWHALSADSTRVLSFYNRSGSCIAETKLWNHLCSRVLQTHEACMNSLPAVLMSSSNMAASSPLVMVARVCEMRCLKLLCAHA